MLSPNQIRKYALFTSLDEKDLEELAAHFSKRLVAKNTCLFYPGSPGIKTYLLEEGLIRLFFINALGQEFLVNLVRPGEVFGLPLLHDDQFRIIGAAASEPSVILSISCQDLLNLAAKSPRLSSNMYHELGISARKLLLHARSLVTLSLTGRLATMLLRLSEKSGDPSVIDMPLTQTEFAGWLGASRGRLNRAMKQLQDQGLIQLEGQKISVLDRSGLQQFTEEANIEKV